MKKLLSWLRQNAAILAVASAVAATVSPTVGDAARAIAGAANALGNTDAAASNE